MITAKTKQGSIGLITVLITMTILMLVVVGMSDNHISAAQQYLSSENSRDLYYTAEACLEDALKRIEADNNFNNGTLTINNNTATICTIAVSGGNNKTITLTITKGNYTQSFEASLTMSQKASGNNAALIEWTRT